MKINEYIKVLNGVKKAFGNLECIYSIDDEGNEFFPVHYHPTPMSDDKDGYKQQDKKSPVYVCVN